MGRGRRSEDALAEAARQLAGDEGVDLPGAYSTLLGIMTLEQVRELGTQASVSCRSVRPDPEMGRRRVQHDRAFQQAIDDGYLTPVQAAQRGSREAYAERLAARHKLPRELALAVTDNRASLLYALRNRPAPSAGKAAEVDLRRGTGRQILALAGLTAVIIAGLLLLPQSPKAPVVSRSTPRTIGTADLITSDRGEVLGVMGPDPRSVLRAYCAADTREARLEPLDVVPSARLGSGARYGLLRDPRRPDDLLAIAILEDRESNRWQAGDGRTPLVATLAPEGAIQAIRKR